MKIRETTEQQTKTFEMTLTREEAEWLYALIDFPLHESQPDDAVAVWSALGAALDEAFDWALSGASSLVNETSL